MAPEGKKKKSRSPRYPIIGLREAIEKTRVLLEQEGRNRVPRQVAAGAWGYKSLHGSSLQLLSTLNQYGLVEQSKGSVKVSDDGFIILKAPKDSQERMEALERCPKAPPIFEKLYSKYGAELPSDDTLRYELLQQGFIEAAASDVIQSLRETISFVRTETENSIQGGKLTDDEEETETFEQKPPMNRIVNLKSGIKTEWTFPIGGQTASIIFPARKPTRKDLALLKQYLDLSAQSLEESETGENGE